MSWESIVCLAPARLLRLPAHSEMRRNQERLLVRIVVLTVSWAPSPFGLLGSPRQCIGHHLASLMVKLFVVSLVRNFNIDLAMKEEDLRLEETFSIGPIGHGVMIKCIPKTGSEGSVKN